MSHEELKQAKSVKLYQVQNRVTHTMFMVTAESAQQACEKAGWLIGDCWVRSLPGKFQDGRSL